MAIPIMTRWLRFLNNLHVQVDFWLVPTWKYFNRINKLLQLRQVECACVWCIYYIIHRYTVYRIPTMFYTLYINILCTYREKEILASHGSLDHTFAYFSRVFFSVLFSTQTAEQLLHPGSLFQILASIARSTSQGLHVSVRFAAQSAVVRITVKYTHGKWQK